MLSFLQDGSPLSESAELDAVAGRVVERQAVCRSTEREVPMPGWPPGRVEDNMTWFESLRLGTMPRLNAGAA